MTLKMLLAGAGFALAVSAPALAQDAPPAHHEERVVVMKGGPGDGEIHRECRIVIHDGAGGDHGGPMPGHMGEGHMGGGMHMMMMDASKGPITRDQFLAEHGRMFDEMDTNHDGKLDAGELKAMHEHHAGMMGKDADCHDMMAGHMGEHMDEHGGPGMMSFEALDANHDGRLSFDEFSVHFRKMFDKLDKEHKGYLTKSDWPNHIVVMMRHEEHDGDKHP